MTTKNRRKRIYVCSPYRGDEERNVVRAQLERIGISDEEE